MKAAGVPAISSNAEGRCAPAAVLAGPLTPVPAVTHAKCFSVRLSAACMTGSQQRMKAAGVPAIGSNAEASCVLAAVPARPLSPKAAVMQNKPIQ